MSFIAGKYSATWNSLALGQTKDGFDVNFQRLTQIIRGDSYAETAQDAVNQGADMDIGAELIEYNAAAVLTLTWPLSGTIYDMGVIGILDSGKWQSLILTALAGTPAAATPASATFPRSILKENFPVKILYQPKLRTVPIRLRVYPNSGVFGTIT